MTNKEKFKEVFGYEANTNECPIYCYTSDGNGNCPYCKTTCSAGDWWDAEYKEQTTKNNLGVDAVSRQEVLYLIADNDLSMGQVVRGIHALPPVTPQPRKGHWVIKDKMWWVCSACGCQTRMMNKYNVPNFCPACGTDMRESEEMDDKND